MANTDKRFAVVYRDAATGEIAKIVGPFRWLRRAEGVAKVDDGHDGQRTSVVPLTHPKIF